MEAQEAREKEKEKNGGKRKSVVEMLQQDNETTQSAKKAKKAGYQLEPEIAELIEKDILNRKLWDECKETLGDTKQVRVTTYYVFNI